VGQIRDTLDNNKTVWEEVSGGLDILKIGDYEIASRAYIGRFNFKGQDQQKRVGQLSGGERNRLQLAKILQMGANVILLDEPSNDLDIETLRALEDAILVFPGTVMVISHDRWFLDRIATHILSFEGETPEFFTGNYAEFEAYRRKRDGDDLVTKRQKYRKIGA
jgi:energy-dependent translational throttle protein EttA